MERAKPTAETRRGEPDEAGEPVETLATVAAEGTPAPSPLLFGSVATRQTPKAARVPWERDAALWLVVALALLLRCWHLAIAPASIGVALGSVIGVALAYVWMRRAFGWSVAATGALLLAADGFAVAAGRSGTPIGLVPALLALWLLLLFTGVAQARARWLVLAAVPLAFAAALLPIAAVLTPVALAALALLAAESDGAAGGLPSPRRVWGIAAALVALPLAGVALGLLGITGRGGVPALVPATPRGLDILLGVVIALGWLALTTLLVAPMRALWRWYVLASDPRERRRAVWSRLREDARWRIRALLWLAVLLPALALPFAPSAISALPLLPAALALPGMAGEALRTRLPGQRAAALWGMLLVLLALAFAIAALWR